MKFDMKVHDMKIQAEFDFLEYVCQKSKVIAH